MLVGSRTLTHMTESAPEGTGPRVSRFERILLVLLVTVVALVVFMLVMVTNTNRGAEIEREQGACSTQFASGTAALADCLEGAAD